MQTQYDYDGLLGEDVTGSDEKPGWVGKDLYWSGTDTSGMFYALNSAIRLLAG
jgi:hypothetical protein